MTTAQDGGKFVSLTHRIGDVIILNISGIICIKFYSNNKYILWRDLTNNILPWF